MPSQAKTDAPVEATDNVKVAIENIQIVFQGVGTISAGDQATLQTIMGEWFDAYFNDVEERYLYELLQQQQHHRHLQARVP